MAFNIADVLSGVSGSDTGKEQITYLPIDRLDPDENNFYSLDGLDELAGNIELIGLQQPIRVRPGTEAGRYTIVSGHRRRAAILMIQDGGNDMFRDGVPCIIESREESPAMRELRLIYANAATRTMSDADISKQAERVEMLLYQLKEEGREFPGRMRDHVAEACKVSKSKLARLHAIRNKLIPDLLAYFDQDRMSEELAYQMSRLPESAQQEAAGALMSGKKKTMPYAWQVKDVVKELDLYTKACPCSAHAGLPPCNVTDMHIARSLWDSYSGCAMHTSGMNQNGICCRGCSNSASCSWACKECKDRRALDMAIEKEKAAERARQEQLDEEIRQKAFRKKRQEQAKRVLAMAEKLHMKDDAELPPAQPWNAGMTVKEVRKAAAGDFGDMHFYNHSVDLIPTGTSNLKAWAETLKCSTDYLLGLNKEPNPTAGKTVSESDTGPEWQRNSEPPREGRYLCLVDMNTTTLHEQRCDWRDGQWFAFGMPLPALFTVAAWWPLPAEAPHPEWWHGMDDEFGDDEVV